jgi:hypothetical protein
MNKELERYLIIFLLLLLIGLSGCGKKELITAGNPKLPDAVSNPANEEVRQEQSGIQNIPNIVEALTCMFSPDTCEKRKEEREMER